MALLSVCANAHTKLTPENRSFISLHGDLGYSSLLNTIEGQKPSNGVSANIGVDYRLLYNRFLFTAGVEGMYAMYANQMDNLDVMIPMMDTEGDRFGMHVLLDKSHDRAHMGNVNIPILFGMEWGRVYFLVGPKLSVNLYGLTYSSAEITTYGEYERYYSYFYSMPNHQFDSGREMSSDKMKVKWNFNVLAHAELGLRLGHIFKYSGFRLNQEKIRMYLALYMDYGVLNVHNGSNGGQLFGYRDTGEGVQFYIEPLIKSNLADNAVFNTLSVGLKFTVAFEMPKSGKSYIYDYQKVNSGFIKRGGNQSIQ